MSESVRSPRGRAIPAIVGATLAILVVATPMPATAFSRVAGTETSRAIAVPRSATRVAGAFGEVTKALPSRGTTIGSQAYPIPAGALFVDPARGADSNPGTQAAPFRTIKAAHARAVTGGTIVLRNGVYHEQVVISKRVTLQNYPRETVWLDGSKVISTWTPSGSRWVSTGWTARFPHMLGGDTAWRDRFIDAAAPAAAYPDQVFVNGAAQRQVLSASAVTAGTFFVDEAGKRLIIGTDPRGREVRGSVLTQALKIIAPDVVVQGIGVRRYATPYETRGTVLMDARGGTFRHMAIIDNATIGLVVSAAGKRVENVLLERNGLMGTNIDRSSGVVLRDSVIRGNNTERFKKAPVAGGVKLLRSANAVVDNNEVRGNIGTGIWLDIHNSGFKIVNNDALDNSYDQIQIEISQGGIVANNVASGTHTGIRIFDSGNVQVFNNVIRGASNYGIWIAQDSRWKTEPVSGFPKLAKNIQMANNVFLCSGKFGVLAFDDVTGIPADNMGLSITGNLFPRRTTAASPNVAGWGQANKRLVSYATTAELAAAKGKTWRNATSSGCFTSVSSADLAAAQSVAVPLPANVAGALGKPTGYKKVGKI